jgi:hypothetical protein
MKDNKFDAGVYTQAFFTILQAKIGKNSLLMEDAYVTTLAQVNSLALLAEKTIRSTIQAGGHRSSHSDSAEVTR